MAADPRPPEGLIAGGVLLAVLSVSAAAILIRLADAPALSVALWRNVIATALLLPLALRRGEAWPRGRTLLLAIASGVFLSLHFALWITSLDHTTVAASVVLVCTQPIFVALLSRAVLKESVSRLSLGGIAVAFAGTAWIVGGATALSGGALWGNVLALGGSLTVAAYVLIGRSVRAGGVALFPYAVVVYGTAAICLALACATTGTAVTGFSDATWGWFVALAVGPQILGHTVFNWALRYVRAAVLSSTILLEPVVSTLLAWWLLAERPGSATLAGGAVVLGGLALVIRGRERGEVDGEAPAKG
jgi:drug/metabolite transporter (DMT)-like permease